MSGADRTVDNIRAIDSTPVKAKRSGKLLQNLGTNPPCTDHGESQNIPSPVAPERSPLISTTAIASSSFSWAVGQGCLSNSSMTSGQNFLRTQRDRARWSCPSYGVKPRQVNDNLVPLRCRRSVAIDVLNRHRTWCCHRRSRSASSIRHWSIRAPAPSIAERSAIRSSAT